MPRVFLPHHLTGNLLASLAGPALEQWRLEDILPTLIDRACRFIAENAAARNPLFLYLTLTSPHTPLAVNAEWLGRSGLNLYADFVMETDAAVGRVLETLDEHGLTDNTLVFFTSDNGCAPYIGVVELEAKGHFPSAHFRGYKADIWDGGHRVPFLARWPGRVRPGSVCGHTICLNDLMATCADLLGVQLPDNAGEDSVSLLPLLLGQNRAVRESVVHHSYHGRFAIRKGPWKLALCPGSGGWTMPQTENEPPRFAYTPAGDNQPDAEALKRGLSPVQLYDLDKDAGERHNLCKYAPRWSWN